ncbi:hypothetical protein IKF33_01665 [Candidatus Saccharibacteria bacterium]|nr:hypothetical protein [Candidatus Saccharibacteria bacterium]
MRYFGLTGLRALFQTVCFGFIGAVALGSHIFGYPTSEIRDTGGISRAAAIATIDTVSANDTKDIARTFKSTGGSNYSAPVATTASAPTSSNKTLYFNQPISHIANKGNTYCTSYDAGNGIIHCTSYGGKLYYAHRNRAFAGLASANIGDLIVIDGQTFRVESRFQRRVTSADMPTIITASNNAYSAAFMTCAGPNDSERLVIYANRV